MPRGKPTKLTKTLLEAAEEVLLQPMNVIIYTEKELVQEINERLPQEKRIAARTLRDWKQVFLHNDLPSLTPEAIAFIELMQKALRQQKAALFDHMLDTSESRWQRWTWIIERKFKEWNMKQIESEVKEKVGDTVRTWNIQKASEHEKK